MNIEVIVKEGKNNSNFVSIIDLRIAFSFSSSLVIHWIPSILNVKFTKRRPKFAIDKVDAIIPNSLNPSWELASGYTIIGTRPCKA